MNKENNSFLIFKDWAPIVYSLSEADRAAIFTALFLAAEGKPVELSGTAQGVFNYFWAQIEKQDEKWTESRERRRAAGSKGGIAKANNAKQNLANVSNAKQSLANPSNAKQSLATPSNSKHNVNVNVNVNDNVNVDTNVSTKREIDKEKSAKRFTPPTIDEVNAYIFEKQLSINPEKFHSYYTANGWKVGRNPMKDWKAACRSWAAKDNNNAVAVPGAHPSGLSAVQQALADLRQEGTL